MVVVTRTTFPAFIAAVAQYGGTKLIYNTTPNGTPAFIRQVLIISNSVDVLLWQPILMSLTESDFLAQFNNAVKIDGDLTAT